jgi:RHS repeat-associated protein
VDEGVMFAEVQSGSMDDAEEAVKLEVPDVHTRVFREHTDPVFRNRLRATIVGGVITVTPTSQGGGGRPGFLPSDAYLTLAAVYVYDPFNRRVAAALVDPSIGETQFHVWDGWRQVAQHMLDTGTWQAPPTKQFVWGARRDEMLSHRRQHGGTWGSCFLLHGGQDTAAVLNDADGNVVERYHYGVFGAVSFFIGASASPSNSSSAGMTFLWKGARVDEVTRLVQMRNRYYSTETGRFLSPDPLGVWQDLSNMGGEYVYVGNRPLSKSDPFGLQSDVVKEETDLSFGDVRSVLQRPIWNQRYAFLDGAIDLERFDCDCWIKYDDWLWKQGPRDWDFPKLPSGSGDLDLPRLGLLGIDFKIGISDDIDRLLSDYDISARFPLGEGLTASAFFSEGSDPGWSGGLSYSSGGGLSMNLTGFGDGESLGASFSMGIKF